MDKRELNDAILYDVQGGVLGPEDRPPESKPTCCGKCGSTSIKFAPDEMDDGFHYNHLPSWYYYCYGCKKFFLQPVFKSSWAKDFIYEALVEVDGFFEV